MHEAGNRLQLFGTTVPMLASGAAAVAA